MMNIIIILIYILPILLFSVIFGIYIYKLSTSNITSISLFGNGYYYHGYQPKTIQQSNTIFKQNIVYIFMGILFFILIIILIAISSKKKKNDDDDKDNIIIK